MTTKLNRTYAKLELKIWKMTTFRLYPHEDRLIQLTAVPHESRIDIDCTVLLRHAVPRMDMAEETIRRTDLMYPLSKTLTAIMINLPGLTGLVQHPERRLMRDKHVHAGRDGLNTVTFKSLDKKRQTVEMHTAKRYAIAGQEIAVPVQPLNTTAVKTHVMIAHRKQLVPIGLIAEPVEKIQRLRLCSVLSKVSAMHQDIGLRQISETAVPVVRVRQT